MIRRPLTAVAVTAALALICVSVAFNGLFMAAFGRTAAQALTLGVAAGAADILKSCLPWFAVKAWNERKFVFVICAGLTFAFLSVSSFISGLGFVAEMRGATEGQRAAISAARAGLEKRIYELDGKIAALGAPRSRRVVEEDINGLKQARRWQTSKGCLNATHVDSRSLCARYFKLRAELAAANSVSVLTVEREGVYRQLASGEGKAAGTGETSQEAWISRVVAVPVEPVRAMLVTMTALVVELGSGLGLYLALSHSEVGRRSSSNGLGSREHTSASKDEIAMEAVQRYCVDRLVANETGSLSAASIFADYVDWADRYGQSKIEETLFKAQLKGLADELGLQSRGNLYLGVGFGL